MRHFAAPGMMFLHQHNTGRAKKNIDRVRKLLYKSKGKGYCRYVYLQVKIL
jgi:hypothetical protein